MDLTQTDWSNNSKSKPSNVIIDVRTPQEFNDGFIRNAVNINIYDSNDFIEKVQSFSKKDEIYLYCKSGLRSSAACQIMDQLGFENVYNLKGGITDWKGEVMK